jgi:lipopolysaccharide export LptBFGC system permease protein LptF
MRGNKLLLGVIAAVVVLIALFALNAYAFAQEAEETFIQSLENPIMTVISAAIVALLAFISFWLQRTLGVTVEAKHREALQSALENAARLVLKTAMDKDTGGKTMKDSVVEIGDVAMQVGIDYVKQSVPDAIKKFGLDDFLIDKYLRPKLAPRIDAVVQTKVVLPPGR